MKKIDHAYKNFDPQKFLELLKNFDSEVQAHFINDYIIPCIKDYNNVNDQDGLFELYLKDLISSGEFFENMNKKFDVLFKFENLINEDFCWNTAYVLLFKKEKICLLLNFESVTSIAANDVIYLLDQFNYSEKDKLDIKHLKEKLNEMTKDIWTKVYKNETWEETLKRFKSPEYDQVSSIKFGKKYYKESHPEVLELEHVEIN